MASDAFREVSGCFRGVIVFLRGCRGLHRFWDEFQGNFRGFQRRVRVFQGVLGSFRVFVRLLYELHMGLRGVSGDLRGGTF